MRPRLPFMAGLLVSVAFSGCVLDDVVSNVREPLVCLEDRPSIARPALLIANETGIHRLTYNANTKTYIVAGSIQPPASNTYPRMVRAAPVGFYALWDDKIVHYRNDLTKVREAGGEYGSIDIKNGLVYAAGKGTLSTLTLDLVTLDTVGFKAGTHKTSHETLVCGDRAYLLDNVVQPIFIYVVDVSDPRNLRVVSEDDWEGVSHLHAQWIDAERDAWHIVENSGGMGYGSQAIRTYSLDGKDRKELARHYEIQGYSAETSAESGFRILGLWPTSTPWMIVGKDGDTHLGRVDVANAATFRPLLDLKVPSTSSFYGAPTTAANQTLVTVVMDGLRIVDLAQRKVTHSQDLGRIVFDIEAQWAP